MIDPVSSSNAAAAASGVTAAAAKASGLKANDTLDQKQFLMLFVEQLKHQDPMSPMEPDQLTAQLAQFSSLEQLTGINTRLDTLASTTAQQIGSSMLGMLGHEVSYEGDTFALKDGDAPGVGYTLPQAVTSLTATIRDAQGRAARVVELGAQDAGTHEFTFDGRAASGAALGDGTYRVELSATVAGSDQPLAVRTDMTAVIDGVDFTSNPPVLTAGGRTIPLDAVLQVRPAPGAEPGS